MGRVIDKIENPSDLKKLNISEMETLAQEMREAIINRVNLIGGHLAPDLGIVEATIAMHYVFDSPKDKFVFDVSHQCYPHKMITGRKRGFLDVLNNTDISGYTNPKESEHDIFAIGHCSTSISLACGLAKARDLKDEKYNVIALIGDGSLSGGEAFEGLNNSAVLNSNFIIIFNDNEMSIPKNEGGIYKNIEVLRKTQGKAENNLFRAFGFDYIYVEEGNNIEEMIDALKSVKDIDHPIVVHIHTLKGKGFQPAVEQKEKYHFIAPGFLNEKNNNTFCETYNSVTKDFILSKKENEEPIEVITAATPAVFEFDDEFRQKMGRNYKDIAISEEHSVAFASGLAKNGAKPILALVSSFIQRTYDQLSQDLALNNSPATILVYWGGISGADMTHLCTFDIPLIANIPNIVYFAPTNKEEYLAILNWSYNQNDYPVVIRVPSIPLVSTGIEDKTNYSELNKYKMVEKGEKVAILGLGNFFELGKNVKKVLKNININATLINPVYITGLDEKMLNNLKSDHDIVITLEDGELDGGWGEKISRFYGNSDMKVLNYGSFKEFTDRVSLDELYKKYRLTPDLICEDIKKLL